MPRTGLLALLLAAMASAVYLNALSNPFVFDDQTEILENPSIVSLQDWRFVVRYSVTRPLTNLSYTLDFAVWGLDPFGYHLTNLVLHVVNVLLVSALVKRVAGDLDIASVPPARATMTAFTAAGLFAVHPMMTEAVGYVSGRAEVLCATWSLASFLCFRRALTDRRRILGASAVGTGFFLLALATKEIAVMLPLVVLSFDLLRRLGLDGSSRARSWGPHALPLLLMVVLGTARVWFYVTAEHPDAAAFDWRNLLVNLHVAERYLSLLVFPASQSVIHAVYPFRSVLDVRLLTTLGVLGLAVAMAVAARRRSPLITFGLVWFFLFLVPSAALILLAPKAQPMAEHRVYLASCGFFMACASFVANFVGAEAPGSNRRLIIARAFLALALGTLMGLTIARNRVWSEPVRLWEDAARKAPRTPIAHYAVGDAYREIGDCETAAPSYRRAIALLPTDVKSYLGLADCLVALGDIEEARRTLRTAIARVPNDDRLIGALTSLPDLQSVR